MRLSRSRSLVGRYGQGRVRVDSTGASRCDVGYATVPGKAIAYGYHGAW